MKRIDKGQPQVGQNARTGNGSGVREVAGPHTSGDHRRATQDFSWFRGGVDRDLVARLRSEYERATGTRR